VRFQESKRAEHWDVLQDEATEAESISGLSMFGDRSRPDLAGFAVRQRNS
jgi:hypothetical protein